MALDTNSSIVVSNFSISADGQYINVTVSTTAGYLITGVSFWTDATFDDTGQLINLTSLLSQTSNTEVFSISTSDVDVTTFYDGIFFAEFATNAPNIDDCDTCNNRLGVAAKLVSAKLCLLEKVKAYQVCRDGCDCGDGCGCGKCDIINLDNVIDAMTIAIEYGKYFEAIDLLNVIRKLCTSCTECLDLDGMTSNSGLNYYTLNNTFILK